MSLEFNMSQKLSIYLIIILHAVGIVGTLIPATSSLTISLTPVNLLISSTLLIYHSYPHRKGLLFFGIAFVIGMLIEIIGVSYGWPFGSYLYGYVLGPKFMGVPWIIGINWFMLSFSIGTICQSFSSAKILPAACGATLMVGLDLLIEPVAISLNYWQWAENSIPISNYISWWFISFSILLILLMIRPNLKIQIPTALIISQVGYFLAILFFY